MSLFVINFCLKSYKNENWSVVPCYIPETAFGIYKLHKQLNYNTSLEFDTPLNSTTPIQNGQVVEFSCEEGYEVLGSSNMRCYHGEWAVTLFPECSPGKMFLLFFFLTNLPYTKLGCTAPCSLPKIYHGQYLSGYRAGLTIANGSSVTFQCDKDYLPTGVQIVECLLGSDGFLSLKQF